MKREEGFVAVTGGKVWYEIVGEGDGTPLIVLHGGPGYPHDYLQPLEELSDSRKIVFYDQLGCGNSSKPKDTSLWTIERFVIELQQVIKSLNISTYYLFGHSWGTALAVSYALTKPDGLASMILSDSYLSTPIWEKDAKRLLGELPQELQEALQDESSTSDIHKKAWDEYFFRFVYRFKEFPVAVLKAEYKMNSSIYNFMWGSSEFNPSGSLKVLDLTPRLSEITVPVLLLCGRYDEATPESTEYFKSLFPNAQSKIFENSAHFPFWTDREEYIATVRNFLQD